MAAVPQQQLCLIQKQPVPYLLEQIRERSQALACLAITSHQETISLLGHFPSPTNSHSVLSHWSLRTVNEAHWMQHTLALSVAGTAKHRNGVVQVPPF